MNLSPRQLTLTCCLLAATCSAAEPASAVVEQRFNFTQDGYQEGATVTGSFAGIDLDNNGILVHFPLPRGAPTPPIQHYELTSFAMHFSGNSLSPAFDLTLGNLYGFVFELDTDGIGDDPAFDPTINDDLIEGIGAVGTNHFYTSGLGPNGFIGGYVGGQLVGPGTPDSLADNALDVSPNLVRVTLVPEPAVGMMVAAGVIAAAVVGGRVRRRGR